MRQSPRSVAILLGSTTYEPKNPCKRGHRRRYTRSRNCIECYELGRERRRNDPAARAKERVRVKDYVARYAVAGKVFGSKQWAQRLCNGAAQRAKRDGTVFDRQAVMTYLEEASQQKRCPIFDTAWKFGRGRADPASPSLDRIIPERGYVAGNLALISYRANTMKRDGSVEDLEKIARWMRATAKASTLY